MVEKQEKYCNICTIIAKNSQLPYAFFFINQCFIAISFQEVGTEMLLNVGNFVSIKQ